MSLAKPWCPGPIHRREWLRLGGLSLGTLVSATAAPLAHAAAGVSGRRDFSVILFWANGGPSHLDLFDLKPDAPSEIRGPFRPIATSVPGVEITELLPRLAQRADRFTLLRSLHHERNEHSGGTHRFLSGYASRAANLQDAEFPEIGSIIARHLRDPARDVPPFVANTKFYGGGPAYLGPGSAPYMPNPNPQSSTGNNVYDPIPIYNVGGSTDSLAITADGAVVLYRRRQLLQTLESLQPQIERVADVSAMNAVQQQAFSMLTSPRLRSAFDLAQESEATRRAYGLTHWGRSLLTCRRLVESGVRFVQCQAEFRLRTATGRTSNWDDHSVNSHIFNAYIEKLPSFDESVSALLDDLHARGLSERVLFMFCGEFGRTPRIGYQDASGRPGRDHWSRAMSVFLAGGGLRMGQAIGATNARAEEPVQRAMDSNCLLATLYERFGVNPHETIPDLSGRPMAILPHGEPIGELL
jgi:hypothetical protein